MWEAAGDKLASKKFGKAGFPVLTQLLASSLFLGFYNYNLLESKWKSVLFGASSVNYSFEKNLQFIEARKTGLKSRMAKLKAALFRYRLLCIIIDVVVVSIILNQKLSNVSQPFASVRCAFRWAFARTYIWAIKNCKASWSLCSSEAFELAGQCVWSRQAGMLLAVPTRHNNGMWQKRGTLCCMLARSLQKKRARL